MNASTGNDLINGTRNGRMLFSNLAYNNDAFNGIRVIPDEFCADFGALDNEIALVSNGMKGFELSPDLNARIESDDYCGIIQQVTYKE